ncbi:glycosyltransferase 61 family protein [Lentibacillus sediminis]
MTKKGFKKVTLGSLSIQEQVNIFSSANFIISAHGVNY